jgi:hypothetical protein
MGSGNSASFQLNFGLLLRIAGKILCRYTGTFSSKLIWHIYNDFTVKRG